MATPSELLQYYQGTGESGRRRMYTNQDPAVQVNTAFDVHQSAFDRDTSNETYLFSVGGGQSTTNKAGADYSCGRLHALHALGILKYAYKLEDRIKFRNLDISIENKKGGIREWFNPHNNTHGKTKMTWAYGYIRMTEGMDGDHVDCFIGPNEAAKNVYVITTNRAPSFKRVDEQKCMLGFDSAEDAKKAFLDNYNKPEFFRDMKEMSYEEFERKALATKDSNRHKIAKDISADEIRKKGRNLALKGLGISILSGAGYGLQLTKKDEPLLKKVTQSTKIKIHTPKNSFSAYYALPGKKNKEFIVLGDKLKDPAILAHEIGHSKLNKSRLGRLIQNAPLIHAGNFIHGWPVAMGIGYATGRSKNKKVRQAGRYAPLIIGAPGLLSEAGASIAAIHHLHGLGAKPKQLLSAGATLLPAFGTYVGNTMLATGMAHAGSHLGEKHRKKKAWFEEPQQTNHGSSNDAVPGDYLGMPHTSLVGARSVKGDPMSPQDKILNQFRFMDLTTDMHILDSNAGAAPSSPEI